MTLLGVTRDLLIPARCAGCRAPGAWLCTRCRDECEPAVVRPAPGLVVRGAGAYGGALRDAIHRFKYGAEPGLAHELGGLLADQVARDLATGAVIDALVPVPLHPGKRLARGYDQAAMLAEVASVTTGVAFRPALHRIASGPAQVELGREARAGNVRGAFVSEAASLRGLRVALVDDVATTCATLLACARACRVAGARAVRAYVLALDE
ncbi:MAG: ComF family protein [Chloroflexi bacterium]|nr:ComF family protein [Chloroflexota bacterium]